MYEIMDLNPDSMSAEVAYRRSLLVGNRPYPRVPRGRWWRRRGPITN